MLIGKLVEMIEESLIGIAFFLEIHSSFGNLKSKRLYQDHILESLEL